MSYIDRLKVKISEKSPSHGATKATEAPFVPFVASLTAPIYQISADREDLTACIIELCQIAGHTDEARERMLATLDDLPEALYQEQTDYFREQVASARNGTYWAEPVPKEVRRHNQR